MATNIQVQQVQRLRFRPCTSGSFNVDETTNMSSNSWIDLPFTEGTADFTFNRPTESPGYARQNRDQHPEEILMPKSWTGSFSINLGVPDDRAATTATIEQTPCGALLKLVMGGEKLGIGDTIDGTSASTNVFPVDTIASFAPGQVVGFGDTNGVLHLRTIEDIAGDTFRTKQLLPFTPADNDAVYGTATYYLAYQDVTTVQTGQFVIEGLGTSPAFEDCWVMRGGQATSTFTIDLPNNGIPRLTFTFEGTEWDNGDDAELTPAALGTATYSETNEVVVADCQHLIQTVGTTAVTGATYMITDLTISPDIYHLKLESSGGTNGVFGYTLDGNHPKCTGSFTHAYEGQTWKDARDARTKKTYQYQIGSSESNGALLVDMPTTQITNWQRQNAEGIAMQEVEFKCRLDEDTTGTATALATSPIRLAIA